MNRNQELSDLAAALREIAARLEALAEGDNQSAESAESVESAQSSPIAPIAPSTPTLTFPLNDRYRFMRELFGNSASRFNETLGALTETSGEDEVARVLQEAEVAVDSETGKEFIAAVAAQLAK